MACKNDGYPFDFDGSLRYTRLPETAGVFPWPSMIGAINGTLHLMDVYTLDPVSSPANGPGIGSPQPIDLSNYMGVMEFPTLQKVKG